MSEYIYAMDFEIEMVGHKEVYKTAARGVYRRHRLPLSHGPGHEVRVSDVGHSFQREVLADTGDSHRSVT